MSVLTQLGRTLLRSMRDTDRQITWPTTLPPLITWALNRVDIRQVRNVPYFACVYDYSASGLARLNVNTDKLAVLNDTQHVGFIILHELVHLFLLHVREVCPKDLNPQLWSRAQEFACNSTAMYLCFLSNFQLPLLIRDLHSATGHDCFPHLHQYPENLSTRGYYDLLSRDNNFGQPSDHASPSSQEMIEGESFLVVAGNSSSSLNELDKMTAKLHVLSENDSDNLKAVIKKFTRRVIPNYKRWNSFLTSMTKTAYGEKSVSGFRKMNPRLCGIDLGTKRLPYHEKRFDENARPKVFVFLDASGSMALPNFNGVKTFARPSLRIDSNFVFIPLPLALALP